MGVLRLILIEGMIGAGKSTMATQVETWLAGRGEDARAFHEFATDHPIRTRAVNQLRVAFARQAGSAGHDLDGGVPGAGAYPAGQWQRLAERCAGGQQTVLLESTFLQNSVMPVFFGGAPVREVTAVFTGIVREVAAAEPVLIYLRPTDIAAAIVQTHHARGEAWAAQNVAFVTGTPWARRRNLRGQQAVIRLYQAWEQVVDELYGRYPFAKLMVTDPQQDRAAALQQVCASLR